MDKDEATQLLATERKRIEQALAGLDAPLEGDDRVEPGDEGTEDLTDTYWDTTTSGQAHGVGNDGTTD